jgi:type IV secretory pathway component VirB8
MEDRSPARLDALEKKIDAIYVSVERTRKYFMWTLIISVVVIVLPLIGMAFVLPQVISTYSSEFNALQ